ncbi:MAG: hypothetical protein II583_02240 [Oscillospiraceae bacterium]|nr:hypothetical protein [Oscillospiraceae bacterium]
MARDSRVYHVRSPWRTAAAVTAIVLVAALIIAASIFFGFRKYIVYTDDGVRLEVPWLQEEPQNEASGEE